MKKIGTMCIVLSLMLMSGCQTASIKEQQEIERPKIAVLDRTETEDGTITLEFDSQALASNRIQDTEEMKVSIYLPPSYDNEEKSYPVVYYLHGYMESADAFITSYKKKLDEAFLEGNKEFILVAIHGNNQFYTNSPVTGNWEDYVVEEIVPLVDQEFRTMAERESRGICGFSMGGYGAFNIAFKHPDVFSSVLTIAPGAIAKGDLPLALESWASNHTFKRCYAQAFAPNLENEPIYGDIPTMSGTPEDNEIVAKWENGFGNLEQKVDDYLALSQPLNAIQILYGERDSYTWIPRGCIALSQHLKEKDVDHTIQSYDSNHSLPQELIQEYMMPFFNTNLSY